MNMFLKKLSLVVFALVVWCAGSYAEAKQPNVLFIFADDMSYETIETASTAPFTAASLRATAGLPLGQFRRIVWAVSPVTTRGGREDTAFLELCVDVVN